MAKYDKFTSPKNPDRPVQVESAIRDGSGKNIENNYAKQNGYYSTLDVGEADLAENLKTTQGAQITDTPAVLAPVSVAVTDGDFAKMTEFKGRSFAYNQLIPSQVVSGTNNGITIGSNGNGKYTITVNNATGFYQIDLINPAINWIVGHKYLITGSITQNADIQVYISGYSSNVAPFYITTMASNQTTRAFLFVGQTTPNGTYNIVPQIFDLTAMGLSTVSTVDEALEALRSYGIEPTVYNEYSAGKIIDSQPNKIISKGFNQVSPSQLINNKYIQGGGVTISNNTNYFITDFIKVIPNTTYYIKGGVAGNAGAYSVFFYDINKEYNDSVGGRVPNANNTTFTTNSDTHYIRCNCQKIICSMEEFCINISDPALNGTYKAYVEDEHILDLPVMRSAGSVADDTTNVNVGSVDLGELSWNYNTAYNFWISSGVASLIKRPANVSEKPNIIAEKYIVVAQSGEHSKGELLVTADGNIWVKVDSQSDPTPTGILNYELATPTPQSPAIILPENIRVYNGGSLETEYESPNTTPGLVSMLYQVNLKNYLEGQGAREDINWNPHNIVSQEELASGLAPKADTTALENGDIIPQFSENLTPYDDESGADQTEPFSFQATGTANGTMSDFATGSIAQLKEKRGNTVCVNQLIRELSETYWDNTNSSVSYSNNVATFTVSASYGNIHLDTNASSISIISGHKYLAFATLKLTTANTSVIVDYKVGSSIQVRLTSTSTTNEQTLYKIDIANATGTLSLLVSDARDSGFDAIQVKNIQLIDLTQWFGSNSDIPPDLLDHPENFFRYYSGSLAYNTGELVSSNAQYLRCIGRQQWDEEWEVGVYDNNTGEKGAQASGYLRSKNFIRVLPNTKYYLTPNLWVFYYDINYNYLGYRSGSATRPFTTSSNCAFITFNTNDGYGNTYKNDITISIYYEGESGYDQYYPYEVLENVDTGTEELHSAGSVYDVKVPSGAITRRIGSYTFTGSETITSISEVRFRIQLDAYASNIKSIPANVLANAIIPGLKCVVKTSVNGNDYQFGLSNEGEATHVYLFIYLTSTSVENNLKTFLTGKSLYYELATETLEQGTPFQENLDIDDFGTMEFGRVSDDATPFDGVPQGNLIFYPVDYKAFIDTMYDYTDGSPENLVLQEELGAESEARSATDVILQNAVGGTLRQLLVVSKSIDFNNTDFVDMGDLNYVYYGDGCFVVSGSSSIFSTNENNRISTMYKNNGQLDYQNATNRQNANNLSIYGWSYNVWIKNTAYTDATAFKNVMKGVLLAYEKA